MKRNKQCSEKDDLFARDNDKNGYMQCQVHLCDSAFCNRKPTPTQPLKRNKCICSAMTKETIAEIGHFLDCPMAKNWWKRKEITPTQPQWEIKLAKYGTPMATFQICRTDAVSEMLDEQIGGGICKTSRLYSKLDKCVESILLSEKSRLLQQIKDIVPPEEKTCKCVDVLCAGCGWNVCRKQMLSELKKII